MTLCAEPDVTASPHDLLPRRRFTVDDFHRMGEAGILAPHDRLELIEGEIVEMSPIGSRHLSVVNTLNHLLVLHAGNEAIVSVQNPVQLGDHSEPEPDLALLTYREDRYRNALPTAKDVLLLVEVADTSLESDRDVKLPLYARHEVPWVWLFDLRSDTVEVHSDPSRGAFRSTRRLAGDDELTLDALNLAVRVGELFH